MAEQKLLMEVLQTKIVEDGVYSFLRIQFRKLEYFAIAVEEAEDSAMALFGTDYALAQGWFETVVSEALAAIHLEDYAKDCAYEAEFF